MSDPVDTLVDSISERIFGSVREALDAQHRAFLQALRTTVTSSVRLSLGLPIHKSEEPVKSSGIVIREDFSKGTPYGSELCGAIMRTLNSMSGAKLSRKAIMTALGFPPRLSTSMKRALRDLLDSGLVGKEGTGNEVVYYSLVTRSVAIEEEKGVFRITPGNS